MPAIEICLSSDDLSLLKQNLNIIEQSAAQRIELCSAMHHSGLTPSVAAIKISREYFSSPNGLLVMIRPRSGDFCYDNQDIALMQEQISQAAEHGVDGVVLAALNEENQINHQAMQRLLTHAKSYQLQTTFHRAFDALENPLMNIATLVDLGVDRILTSGVKWGEKGGALEGIEQLKAIVKTANNQIEIVVGGGVSPSNIHQLNQQLCHYKTHYSFHAYSSVLKNNRVQPERISALVI